MEKKESRVFGLPLTVVVFIVALAVLIDGFSWFFVFHPLHREVAALQESVNMTNSKVLATPTLMPSITATPSATVTPTYKFYPHPSLTPAK